ncbi:MAG: hypothetical protein LC799_05690, partial [Actinobacteria bacterium]|nr:hypothetical protein [Actinomycetota bacterium]
MPERPHPGHPVPEVMIVDWWPQPAADEPPGDPRAAPPTAQRPARGTPSNHTSPPGRASHLEVRPQPHRFPHRRAYAGLLVLVAVLAGAVMLLGSAHEDPVPPTAPLAPRRLEARPTLGYPTAIAGSTGASSASSSGSPTQVGSGPTPAALARPEGTSPRASQLRAAALGPTLLAVAPPGPPTQTAARAPVGALVAPVAA